MPEICFSRGCIADPENYFSRTQRTIIAVAGTVPPAETDGLFVVLAVDHVRQQYCPGLVSLSSAVHTEMIFGSIVFVPSLYNCPEGTM